MNYALIYNNIIEKRRLSPPIGYSEKHHIIPKSMGGGNHADNIVRLPPREHFIAHLCLAKIHGGKMIYAAWRMAISSQYNTSRKYEWIRTALSEELKGNQYAKGYFSTDELREKRRINQLGKKSALGYKFTLEQKLHLSEIRKGNTFKKGKKESEQSCYKKRLVGLGRFHSEENKKKMSEIAKITWAKRKASA